MARRDKPASDEKKTDIDGGVPPEQTDGGGSELEGGEGERPTLEGKASSGAGEREDDGPEDDDSIPDHVIDRIAEVITKAQIDRLIKLRANIDRRDEYRKRGIRATTHVVMLSGCTLLYNGKRHDAKKGDALEIAKLDDETHACLITDGHAERPA